MTRPMPHETAFDAERTRWYEMAEVVRSLTPDECLVPGYYRDPDWTVRDLVAHVGTWLAEAESQFERMRAGSYDGHEIDVDALNAELLEAMAGQPWDVTWVQANAGRTRMIEEWRSLEAPSDESAWWIDKAAAAHYADHMDRLRAWATELIERR
jgi:Mycothiol maleylpyruvate isomerase N-terminal domain